MTKTEKKIVKQIEESLKNFEGVKLSNKLKAESIYLVTKPLFTAAAMDELYEENE